MRLELIGDIQKDVGYGLFRESEKLTRSRRVYILLKRAAHNGMPHYILTSYLNSHDQTLKTEKSYHPNLSGFIRNYLNEDFDLWGNSIAEIVTCYRSENNIEAQRAVLHNIYFILNGKSLPKRWMNTFINLMQIN